MKKNEIICVVIIISSLVFMNFLICHKEQIYQQKNKQINKEIAASIVNKEITAPIVNKETKIDLDKIWFIESSRGKNLWNKKSRARGHYQFIESTWNECVGKMGKDWDWWTCSMDKEKSEQVSNYYYNTEIPRLLKYYKIDDSIETRIACYDWGIGHLNKNWKKYKNKWVEHTKEETKKYIRDYHNL